MRQGNVKLFVLDVIAYCVARNSVGRIITQISNEIEKLETTEVAVKSIVQPAPHEENAPMRGGLNLIKARKILYGAKDPRYVRNPFYKPKKHKCANGHHLFDKLSMTEATENPCEEGEE